MKNQTVIYLSLLILCVAIAGVTLGLYYSQDFKESYLFNRELRLVDVQFEAYDQYDYNTNYNCYYDQFGNYVCDAPQNANNIRVLQSATVNIGSLKLDNQGLFTQIYEAPRLLGCIEFASYEASNGLRFPREFSIEYKQEGKGSSPQDNYRHGYAYYGREGPRLEIKSGKNNTYILIARYTPYSIPLNDFTKENIKSIVIYKIPIKESNPLAEDYNYNNFYYNPSCELAEQKDIDPIATITVV